MEFFYSYTPCTGIREIQSDDIDNTIAFLANVYRASIFFTSNTSIPSDVDPLIINKIA